MVGFLYQVLADILCAYFDSLANFNVVTKLAFLTKRDLLIVVSHFYKTRLSISLVSISRSLSIHIYNT